MQSASTRRAAAALTAFAAVDVICTVLAVGHYEWRITVGTHGAPDLAPAAFAYELFAYVVEPLGRAWGFADAAGIVRRSVWLVALVVAVAAVGAWWYRARPVDRRTVGLLGAAAGLTAVSAAYSAVAAPPGPVIDGVLATRPVAYPLWTAATVVVVVAARRFSRGARFLS